MTPTPSPKERAAEAIDAALTNAERVKPFTEDRYLRYIIADLETARAAVSQIEETKRPRRKKGAPNGSD